MKAIELASIAGNEKHKLKGFSVLGINIPFSLQAITTGTQIELSKIKLQLQELNKEEPNSKDYEDPGLMSKIKPLVEKYCVVGLMNSRKRPLLKYLLLRQIKKSSHKDILSIFATIQQLNEPAFFLTYWTLINRKENTILKEGKQ